MMRRIVLGCLATAVFLIGVAFTLAGYWIGFLLVTAIGGLWLVGVQYGRSPLVTLGFVGLILVTAVAGALHASPMILLTGVALTLFAWTLGNVEQRLTAVDDIRDESELIKKHVQWVGGVIGLGWIFGMVALNVQLSLTFGWALLLGIMVVFALSRFVRRLQQEDQQHLL